jgi:hypothetical protein
MGFWTGIGVAMIGWFINPIEIGGIMALGHLIYQARERWLPCKACGPKPEIPFAIVGKK